MSCNAFRLIFVMIFYQRTSSLGSDYKYWSPDNIKDLWCPMKECSAINTKLDEDYCCACFAVPQWQLSELFPNISYSLLLVEIITANGRKSRFVTTRMSNISNITSFYGVVHVGGYLKEIPGNLCDYRLVHIDFSLNLLTEIGEISCSVELDTLILKYNRIEFVSNTSFAGLFKLRIVDLLGNRIKKLDNNIFGNIHVLSIILEYNRIETLDVSNIFLPNKTVCVNSFAYNQRAIQVTNQNNLQLVGNEQFVCGSVDYANVTMSDNPVALVATNLKATDVLKYMPCGYYKFDGSAYNCDCKVGEFLKFSLDIFNRFWNKPEQQNYCNAPPSLENISVVEVWDNPILADKMICDIVDNCSKTVNCHCQCTSQPSRQTLIVDCSNQKCKSFPDIVPNSKENYTILLNMSNNSIDDVGIKYYFNRVKTIDLSKNPVSTISEDVSKLNGLSELIIPDHNLKYLPREIQHLHPNVFQFGQRGIPCTCENQWIGQWRTLKKPSANHTLYCSNYNKTFEEMLNEFMGCNVPSDPGYIHSAYLVPIIVVFVLLPSILYVFRYELTILKRKHSRTTQHMWKYDLYISCDDKNPEIRDVVIRSLASFLEEKYFSTFILCRDSMFASYIEESVINNIRESKNVLIVYSDEMFTQMDNNCKARQLEYSYAWNYYTRGMIHGLRILRFDKSKLQDFQYRQTKALFNCGMGISIFDRTIDIYENMLQFLGRPLNQTDAQL